MNKLSHIDQDGKASMVDVSDKKKSVRIAKAVGKIKLQEETVKLIRDNRIKKGDVLTVAEIAGIQGAKETSRMIPLCHNIEITKVDINCSLTEDGVTAESLVKCVGNTGVEMEALTGVSLALLTIYDMCKAVDKEMTIEGITLKSKEKFSVV